MDNGPGAFVGRERETAALREMIAAARDGQGGVVLVSGPGGIGKSRLVTEAVAGERSVVWGRCPDEDGTPPLWPWLRIAGRLPTAALITEAGGSGGGDAAESAAERFRLLVLLTDALVEAAEDLKGLVVVIEDVHDADEASLAVLRQVAAEAAGSRLLVVATHRDGSPRQAGGFARTLAEVARSRAGRTIALAPLTVQDVTRYLAALPGGPALAPLVHERTGGLPLLVSAMARALARSGTPDRRLPDLPAADLRPLVLEMLGGLDPAVRGTVSAAAVLGAEPDPALVADVRELPPAVVSRHLDALAAAGLLVPLPGAPSRYRFAHALVRDGVVAEAAREAPALHRRAAESLERRAGVDPAQAARIAAHWQAAGDDAATLRAALRWTRAAAAHALRSSSPEQAARLLGEALAMLAPLGTGPAERAGLLIELATAESLAGRAGRAAAHCREAADLARSAGLPGLLADAALVVCGTGDQAVLVGMSELCDRALAELYDRAPAEQGDDTSAVTRARLLARKASLDVEADRPPTATPGAANGGPDVAGDGWPDMDAVGGPDVAGGGGPDVEAAGGPDADAVGGRRDVRRDVRRAVGEALRLAEECGDPVALLDATRARVGLLDRPGDVGERRRMGELAVSAGTRTGRPMTAVRGHIWRLDAAYQLVDLVAADDGIARLGELADATRLPTARWYHLRAGAARAALAGEFDVARARSAAAGEIAARMDAPLASMVTDMFGQLVALVRGDRRELPAGYRAAFGALPGIPVAEAAVALCLSIEGNRDEAYARYEHLRLLLREPLPGVRGLGVLQHLTELVEVFDDAEAAGWAHALWLPWAAAGGLPGGAESFCGGSCARGAGRMAAVMGRLDEAAVLLRTATEVDLRLGARPWLTHGRLALADVLLRRGGPGDRAEAAGLATRAAAEARRLDLPGPLARAGLLLSRAETLRRADDPLTAREREVAALVVQAMSNRGIADRLVLSERTVETHVRNILTKLGLSNRTELTAHLLGGPH
ncbi:helix-turn-helix transcriptional regulator [Sphaerisporangium corydalis]|uniref:AAA family ATPase n=1 Tax=Sphaerisporangium corydalis TaxID=1441875 RepID=A0ABV9E5Z3_9ACTN|nr:LuxR family transcriptional regulator [Sphaerisporangium corydalis]